MKRTARKSPPSPTPKGVAQAAKSAAPRALSARAVALAVLVRVETQGAYGSRALDAALERSGLTGQDRALATELVYGTLRFGPALDATLEGYLAGPMQRLPIPIRHILRLGAYQLVHLRVPAYSAVNESVALVAKRYGKLLGLVNAILRRMAREHADDAQTPGPGTPPACADAPVDLTDASVLTAYATQMAHPTALVTRLVAMLGSTEAQACVAANNRPPTLSLRVNLLVSSREALREQLLARGIAATASPWCPETLLVPPAGAIGDLPGFAAGAFAVQDAAATLVGHLLAPAPGSTVFDLCAAPGGKSAHAMELMGGLGQVIAIDVHAGRSTLIAKNAARLGHSHITPVVADVAAAGVLAAVCQDAGIPQMDYALLDAPCSALGTLRRHPELRRADGTSVARLAALQATLLDAAAPLMAPGGVLVYAVCTVTPEEGPEQIAAFLRRHPDFVVEPPPQALSAFLADEGPYLRTWPHRHDLDGFFAARLVRGAAKLASVGPIP